MNDEGYEQKAESYTPHKGAKVGVRTFYGPHKKPLLTSELIAKWHKKMQKKYGYRFAVILTNGFGIESTEVYYRILPNPKGAKKK